MNEYDSNRILAIAEKINYKKTENLNEADCYVLNTCHIREKATDKVYHDIGRIKKNFRNKSKPVVLVTGCVAQAEGEILMKKEKYIDAVIGPQSYHHLDKIIKKIETRPEKINSTNFEVIEKFDTLNSLKNSDGKISSYLTIQEGCNKFCKFCVVPYTRGAEFSRSIKELFDECKYLADTGSREITLLGQNVNAYNFNGQKLPELVKKISLIKNLKRIRYTTSHPIDFTDDLIRMHSETDKLMPLIHLPVQSGSNKILKEMNRGHTIEDYLKIIDKLKRVNPLLKFSSDFIIGYPGETENDFNQTLNLLKEVKFINSYSFIYSERPGTPAAKLKRISDKVTKERLKIFQKESDKIKLDYRKNLFNKKSKVLFENRISNNDKFFGKDEYSNSIIVTSKENIKGKIKKVKIIRGDQNTLYGELNIKFENKEFAA